MGWEGEQVYELASECASKPRVESSSKSRVWVVGVIGDWEWVKSRTPPQTMRGASGPLRCLGQHLGRVTGGEYLGDPFPLFPIQGDQGTAEAQGSGGVDGIAAA
jgi:hypothetical protein